MLSNQLNSELIALRAVLGAEADILLKKEDDGLFTVMISPDGQGWITVATDKALEDVTIFLHSLRKSMQFGKFYQGGK